MTLTPFKHEFLNTRVPIRYPCFKQSCGRMALSSLRSRCMPPPTNIKDPARRGVCIFAKFILMARRGEYRWTLGLLLWFLQVPVYPNSTYPMSNQVLRLRPLRLAWHPTADALNPVSSCLIPRLIDEETPNPEASTLNYRR